MWCGWVRYWVGVLWLGEVLGGCVVAGRGIGWVCCGWARYWVGVLWLGEVLGGCVVAGRGIGWVWCGWVRYCGCGVAG